MDGNPLSHPNLLEILEYAKTRNIICNITIKDVDIIKNIDLVHSLYNNNLIKSIGISPTTINTLEQAVNKLNIFCNWVLHLILGVHDLNFIKKLQNRYIDNILFLGYKNYGKGKDYFSHNIDKIQQNIYDINTLILTHSLNIKAKIISFDNLAIEQLNLKELPDFNMYYQGPDGKFSLYIDAVEKLIGKSSFEEHLNTFGHRDLDLSFYLNY